MCPGERQLEENEDNTFRPTKTPILADRGFVDSLILVD